MNYHAENADFFFVEHDDSFLENWAVRLWPPGLYDFNHCSNSILLFPWFISFSLWQSTVKLT